MCIWGMSDCAQLLMVCSGILLMLANGSCWLKNRRYICRQCLDPVKLVALASDTAGEQIKPCTNNFQAYSCFVISSSCFSPTVISINLNISPTTSFIFWWDLVSYRWSPVWLYTSNEDCQHQQPLYGILIHRLLASSGAVAKLTKMQVAE